MFHIIQGWFTLLRQFKQATVLETYCSSGTGTQCNLCFPLVLSRWAPSVDGRQGIV